MEELVAREHDARRRFRRRRLWTLGVVVLLLVSGLALNLFLAMRPARIRALVQSTLSELLPGEVTFSERIDVHWGEGITLRHLALVPPEGSPEEAVLRVRRVVLRADFSRLLLGGFRVAEIVLEEPVVSVERDADGRWNLEGALPAATGESAEGWKSLRSSFPRVVVSSGALNYSDAHVEGAPIRHSLLDINGALEGSPRGVAVDATARTPFLDRLDLRFELGEDLRAVDLVARATKLDISGRLARLAGPEAHRLQRGLDLHGFVNVEGRFQFTLDRGLVPTGVSGELVNCHMQPPRFPIPLERLSGKFRMDGETLRIEALQGWLGAGAIRGGVELRASSGWRELVGLSFTARAEALPLDSRLRPWVPPRFLAVFDRLSLRGNVAVECRIETSEMPLGMRDVSLDVSFDDIGWSYRGYPYSFEKSSGRVKVDAGRFEIVEPIVSRHGEVDLGISGAGGIESDAPLDLRLRVAELPLDNAVRNALPPTALVSWDRLRPSGKAAVDVAISSGRSDDGAPQALDVTATIDCEDVSIRWESFPYDVTEINGRLLVDFQERRLRLEGLRGFHDEQRIAARGEFELGGDELVDLTLEAESIELDEDMREALPADVRALVGELGVRGRGAVVARVTSSVSEEPAVEVEIDVKECDAEYIHFRYPLRFESGKVRFTRDRRIELDGLSSRPLAKPSVSLSGEISTTGAERIFDFRCAVGSLPIGPELVEALPEDLSRLLGGIGMRGRFSGELVGTHSYNVKNAALGRAQYHARGVRFEDVSLDFGIAFREITAEGEFIGKKDLDGHTSLTGVLETRRARFNRLVLGEGDLLFAFGKEHPGIVRARTGETLDGTSFRPTSRTIARLSEEKVDRTLQVQVRRGDLYGGELQGFFWIDVGAARDFGGEFRAGNVQVAKAAPDVFGVDGQDSGGQARGFVGFSGSTGKPESISGSGEVHVSDAKLLRLPLFVNLVSMIFARPSADPHFKTVDIRFDIREGRFWSPDPDGVTILGDAVNLLGAGSMDFSGTLDLALVPHLLSIRIPVFETVIDLLKKPLAQVHVSGKLEKPRVEFGTAGGVIKIPVGRSN